MRNDIGFTDNKIAKGTLVGLISPTYKDILILENSPSAITLKTFQETDEGIDLNEAKNFDDLFDQLDCE